MPDAVIPATYDALVAAAVAAADQVVARPPVMATTRLMAVDGPAGSGKTTLARSVATLLGDRGVRADVLSLDDMYDGWAGLDAGLERRVCEQVLEPLAAGRSARWQAYDWVAGAFGSWHERKPGGVLVLEGCGAGAHLFAPYTSLLVWVEAPTDVRTRRAVARDGVEVLAHWAGWAALEREVFTRNAPASRADIVVRT